MKPRWAPVALLCLLGGSMSAEPRPLLSVHAEDRTGFGIDPGHRRLLQECVIGGDGAFLLKISDITQFAEAILKKLVIEISWQKVSGLRQRRVEPARLAATQPFNCFIGGELQERSIGR